MIKFAAPAGVKVLSWSFEPSTMHSSAPFFAMMSLSRVSELFDPRHALPKPPQKLRLSNTMPPPAPVLWLDAIVELDTLSEPPKEKIAPPESPPLSAAPKNPASPHVKPAPAVLSWLPPTPLVP